jgi:hypothetical protein
MVAEMMSGLVVVIEVKFEDGRVAGGLTWLYRDVRRAPNRRGSRGARMRDIPANKMSERNSRNLEENARMTTGRDTLCDEKGKGPS